MKRKRAEQCKTGCGNGIWFLESRVFARCMPVHGHSGGLGSPHASEPGVSTVLQGGVLVWRRWTTALKDGAITGGVAAGKPPEGACGQPAIRAGNHEELTDPEPHHTKRAGAKQDASSSIWSTQFPLALHVRRRYYQWQCFSCDVSSSYVRPVSAWRSGRPRPSQCRWWRAIRWRAPIRHGSRMRRATATTLG